MSTTPTGPDWGDLPEEAPDQEWDEQHADWMDDGIEAGPADPNEVPALDDLDHIDDGEDPPIDTLTGELLDEPAGAPASRQRVLGIDVSSLAEEAVEQAVQGAVARHVAKIATTAVKQALTPDVVARLQRRAQAATAAAVSEHLNRDQEDAPAEPTADEPTLYYGSVDEFVREHLRKVYRRRIDGKNRLWSACWWRYPEAVVRLEAIWRAWEHLRLDPATGTSVWWRDHGDPHLGILTHPDTSPFPAAYNKPGEPSPDITDKGDPLPYEPPPEGLFPDVRQAPPTS